MESIINEWADIVYPTLQIALADNGQKLSDCTRKTAMDTKIPPAKKDASEKIRKTDLRVIKSERAIKKAFWELLEEEGFKAITVKQIIDRAEINRSTFYDHYQDKYDLIDKQIDSLLSQMHTIVDSLAKEAFEAEETSLLDFQKIFERYIGDMLDFVGENAHRFALLMHEDSGEFQRKFKEGVTLVWKDHNIEDRVSIPAHYVIAGSSGMITGLITEWFNTGYKESPQDFAKIVTKVSSTIASGVLKGGF